MDRVRPVWIPSLLVLLLCVVVRIQLLPVPLERDEGEYAYVAQRLLAGAAPYQEAYSLKMPGIHLVYAGILTIFGQSPSGIHAALLLANLLAAGFLFLVGRRMDGAGLGVLAAAAFALLSVGRPVQGVFANAEHFVLPPVVAAWWLLLRGNRRDLFLAGVLLGVAVVIKQHAGAFLVGAGLILGLGPGRWPRLGLLAVGAVLPTGLVTVWLAMRGSLDEAVFWTVTYATRYVASLPAELGALYLRTRGGDVVLSSWPLFVALAAGIVVAARDRDTRIPLLGFLAAGMLAVVPGLYFRPHYFVLLLPALALLAARGIQAVPHRLGPAGVATLVFAVVILGQRAFLFGGPDHALRACYGREVFAASPAVGEYLAAHSGPDDTVAVFGSEPQLCFYAQRKSASGYIYVYPLMESHDLAARMQQEMIDEVRAAAPRLLVFVNTPTSWVATEDSDRRIMAWAQQYWRRHYDRVGVVEIPDRGDARFFWDDAATARLPQGERWLAVFRRRPGI